MTAHVLDSAGLLTDGVCAVTDRAYNQKVPKSPFSTAGNIEDTRRVLQRLWERVRRNKRVVA